MQKLGVVKQELMQRSEGETLRAQRDVVTIQQAELQSLHNEIEHLRLTTGSDCAKREDNYYLQRSRIDSDGCGLQKGVFLEPACRAHEGKLN